MNYEQKESGGIVEINWKADEWLLACCDCGLVHRFSFIVDGDRLFIRGWREDELTDKERKKKKAKK